MTEAQYLFESYNMAIENGYNRIFEDNSNADILRMGDKEIFQCVAGDIANWESTSIMEIGSMTPFEYISSIKELDRLVELFEEGSLICDYDLPPLLLNRLKAFNKRASDILIGFATDKNLVIDDKKFLIPVTSIKVLGQWADDRAISPIIKFFVNEIEENDENYDMVAEEISEFLVGIGAGSVESLLATLGKAESINSNYEYLLKALSEIGKDNKDERIFLCLKNSFRRMKNKILGALFIKNYGDSRAIPLLRGYIEKNAGNIDNETLYEIKHVIESLGGIFVF